MVFVAGPFGQVVVHVDHAEVVKNMAGWSKGFRHPRGVAEIEERGEGEPHAAPFVCDRRAAASTTDLAGQNSFIPQSSPLKNFK